MKVAILGATGWIGRHLVHEAKSRGHEVIALVRDPNKAMELQIEARPLDLLNTHTDWAAALQGVEVLISAVGGRAAGNHNLVVATAERVLTELPALGVQRLLWVGGAGSLEVAPNVTLVSTPQFPDEYKDEALAMVKALEVFRHSQSPVNWTFISPAALIFPGERQGRYRVGGDQLLQDAEGNSQISVSDYAVAMIDELEQAQYPRQRIGVAY